MSLSDTRTQGDAINQQGRQEYLDGLRGVAALVVVATHLSLVIFPSLHNGLPGMARLGWEWVLAGTPLDILWAADFAVCIFFVMSAFVLSAFYDREGHNFIANCVRRYIRLTLPIFAASAIAYALWITIGMHTLEAQQVTQEGWLKQFYLAKPHPIILLTEPFYQIYATPKSVLDPSLWTMKFEFWGSMGVFLFCALVQNARLRFLVLAVAAILLFKTYYLCFVGGVALYQWSRVSQAVRDRVPAGAIWAFLLAGVYMGAFPFNVGGPGNIWFGWMSFLSPEDWHILGAAPFVFGVMNVAVLRTLLMTRVPQYLGKISFSLYLIHVPLIGSLMTWLIVHLYSPPHRLRAIAAAMAITIPVIIACSHFFEKFIDVPSVRFSRVAGKLVDTWFPMQALRTQARSNLSRSVSSAEEPVLSSNAPA